jgi:hypothetical protein
MRLDCLPCPSFTSLAPGLGLVWRSSSSASSGCQGASHLFAFDSRWVPPVGGAPSRHTGTGGATDEVHAQCLRDSGAGDKSRVVPRAAARRSRVVPRSKQLGSQTRRCRAEQAAGSNKPTSHERDLDVSINSMAVSFHGMSSCLTERHQADRTIRSTATTTTTTNAAGHLAVGQV